MIDRERLGRIFVVGFMGVGKTTVSSLLAEALSFRFIDLDREIERETGRRIPEIFRADGEAEFRRIESRVLRASGTGRDVVIAAGGGTLTVRENRAFIHRHGVTVWLDAPLDLMLERCRGGEHRPLLADRPRMEALLTERLPAYRMSDIRVDASLEEPAALAAHIVALLAALR